MRFAGFRNQTEIPEWFAASDVIVLPSDGGETWGLVVNEAMACGLPAVVSDRAGCASDLIDDGRTGYQYVCGDLGQLTDRLVAVAQLLESDQHRVADAVASRIAQYSAEAAVVGTLEALEAVAAPHMVRRRPLARAAG